MTRHVSGLAPLLVAAWALALAVVAMRGCDVDEGEPPMFVEVSR